MTTATDASDLNRFVNKGSASFKLNPPGKRRDIYFLVLPKMTMLAFSSALEPLRIANQVTGQCLYRWFLLSEDGNPIRCSNGVSIGVDGPIRDIDRDDIAFVCSGIEGNLAATSAAVAWVRRQARHGRIVGGLCTGAFSLARAGLLAGRRFTLHWENQPAFKEMFPNLPFVDELYCKDGRVLTCGGGNAAIDLIVSLIDEHHGPQLAAMVADMCLHGAQRPGSKNQRVSISALIGLRHPVLVSVVETMRSQLANGFDIEEFCRARGISRRQVERLFRKYLKTTPLQQFRDLRLDYAHSLMAETDLSVSEIAAASGFQWQGTFSRAYRNRFGAMPDCRHRQTGPSRKV